MISCGAHDCLPVFQIQVIRQEKLVKGALHISLIGHKVHGRCCRKKARNPAAFPRGNSTASSAIVNTILLQICPVWAPRDAVMIV